MRMEKSELGIWVVLLALATGFPEMAKAENGVTAADRAECLNPEDLPEAGSQFEKSLVRLCRLQPQVDLLRREIFSIEDEAVVAVKRAELAEILPEYREIRAQVNRGGKKFRKIVKKERRIEKLEENIDELEARKVGKSPAEIADLDRRIAILEEAIVSKGKAIGRKEGKYEKITGDKAPSRNGPALPPEPVPVIEPIIIEKIVTHDEKRKNPACWTREDAPLKEKVAVHFPIGSSTLVGTEEFQTKVQDLFFSKTRAVADRIAKTGYKIYKVEATSHASKIPHSKTGLTPAQLAEERSKNAASHFFTNLAVGNEDGENPLDLKAPDFEGAVTVPPKGNVAVGPTPDASSYRHLASLKFGPEQMEAAIRGSAEEIMNTRDPTPVRGTSLEETIENIRACCDTNPGAVRFQPFQFTELTFYGSKFTPDSDACIAQAKDVTTSTAVKKLDDVPEIPATDDDYKNEKPGSRQSAPGN